MEVAKKFLNTGKPQDALDRLKNILYAKNFSPETEWQIHELLGATFADLANADGVVQAYLTAVQTDTILRNQRSHLSNFLFALHYLPKINAQTLYKNALIYNSLYRDQKHYKTQNANHKLKIAFIAPHFLDSSSARFYESLLTDYDKNKFSVSAWSLSNETDNFTKKIQQCVDKYFDISEISFEESAQKIHGLGADFLFDLGGHTDGGATLQIAAYHPAKIQISGIGYFDTTGTDFIDYYLTDKFLLGDNEKFFTEKILELENAFAFKPSDKFESWKVEKSKSENFTFGCLNNFMKINADYLNCVAKILNQVPQSKIIFRDTTPLLSRKFALTEKILTSGILPEQFEVRVGEDNFFSDYGEIDLILDSFPYTGGMMTALALYFNVPVLNLCGKMHYSRLGAEMLRLADLPELIAENPAEYISKAVDFAQGNFQPIKIKIDKLIDTKNFTENFYLKLEKLL